MDESAQTNAYKYVYTLLIEDRFCRAALAVGRSVGGWWRRAKVSGRWGGRARIRSAVNLKINIDRGAANPLFIDADCWLQRRGKEIAHPSGQPPPSIRSRCHVAPNAS